MVQSEEQQNVELIELSNQILELTKAIHAGAHCIRRPSKTERTRFRVS
jgi:hypothetical protein